METPSWLVEAEVLGIPFPETDEALAALADLGVTLLVNLHHERRTPPERLLRHGMAEVHLPVPDYEPPPPAVLEAGIAALDGAVRAGRRAAVHCGGGLGRTGTLLACYLLASDPALAPEDALVAVRSARPGSVETAGQEQAVREFAARRGGPSGETPTPGTPPEALPVPRRRLPPGRGAADTPPPGPPSPRP